MTGNRVKEEKNKKVTRTDLQELLIKESEKNERLEEQLKAAQEALAVREIQISKAGSLAEAAIAINGVFEAAEAACALYKENLSTLGMTNAKACAELETKARQRAQDIIAEAEQKAAKILAEARRDSYGAEALW